MSPPVEGPSGFHIVVRKPVHMAIRLVRISFVGALEASPSVTRTEEEAAKLASECLTRVKNGEEIAVIAQQHSDDISARIGGNVGFVLRSNMKEAFRKSVAHLEVGEHSGVFKTPTGYHLVMRYK